MTTRAVLLSLAEFESLVSARSQTPHALSNEFDELLANMQTPKSRKGMKAAFNASPAQPGRASEKSARGKRSDG
jgi:antitoxin Phd